jgi:hypothetical protein
MAATQILIEKINALPKEHLGAVERFVDTLQSRENDHEALRLMATSSVPSFAAVWDNDADAAYDAL